MLAERGVHANYKGHLEKRRPKGSHRTKNDKTKAEGFHVIYNVRETSLKRDRYIIAPDGTSLRTKGEMRAWIVIENADILSGAHPKMRFVPSGAR